jgi:hypothetical protein
VFIFQTPLLNIYFNQIISNVKYDTGFFVDEEIPVSEMTEEMCLFLIWKWATPDELKYSKDEVLLFNHSVIKTELV